MKIFSDPSQLKALPNPGKHAYEIQIKCPEVTFLGAKKQPDFATLYISFYPKDTIIELKALKFYLLQFRDSLFSYERIINIIYDDMMSVYSPDRLRMTMIFNPRGGISSRLVIDSNQTIDPLKDTW